MAKDVKKPFKGFKKNETKVDEVEDALVKKFGKKKFSKPARTNHLEWYTRNPQLTKDSANFYFSRPTGLPINTKVFSVVPVNVLAYYYEPMLGTDRNATDAATVAARSLYSYVRHANSGHTNYEAPDLGMYIYAMAEIYGMLQFAARLYGIAHTWYTLNRSVPAIFSYILGVDLQELSLNMADFRSSVNLSVRRLRTFALPKGLSLVERKLFINGNVFSEKPEDPKAQLYVMVPRTYLQWDATTYASALGGHGSALSRKLFHTPGSTPMSISSFLTKLNTMIDKIAEDEDIGIMSGDILKAFGDSGLYSINEIAEDYTCELIYDENALQQLKHATVAKNLAVGDVVQDSKGIIFTVIGFGSNIWGKDDSETFAITQTDRIIQPANILSNWATFDAWTGQSVAYSANLKLNPLLGEGILSCDKPDQANPEFIYEATRLMCLINVLKHESNIERNDGTITCGTELISSISMLRYNGRQTYANDIQQFYGLPSADVAQVFNDIVSDGGTGDDFEDAFEDLFEVGYGTCYHQLEAFKFRPFRYGYDAAEWDSDDVVVVPAIYDGLNSPIKEISGVLDYYTTITFSELDRLNKIAVFSELVIDTAYIK